MIDEAIGIGCDWGTTSFRAYLLGRDAQIIEKIETQKGIMSIKDGDFEKVFEEIVGTWMDLYPTCPIVLSGMIGSRQGWLEAPYIECPAQLNQLAKKLTVINLIRKRKVFLVPGLTFKDEEGIPDVMRGEEIQILGSSSTVDQKEQLICLPGSHSKWVRVSCGNVIAFSTYMTGETYEAVRKNTILSKTLEPDAWSEEAFMSGVQYSKTNKNILSQLFHVRTQILFHELSTDESTSFISGLLIGHELKSALQNSHGLEIHLIGDMALTKIYGDAISEFGSTVIQLDTDIVTAGYYALLKQIAEHVE